MVKWSWKKSKVQTTPRCISRYSTCGFMRKACMDTSSKKRQFLLAPSPCHRCSNKDTCASLAAALRREQKVSFTICPYRRIPPPEKHQKHPVWYFGNKS